LVLANVVQAICPRLTLANALLRQEMGRRWHKKEAREGSEEEVHHLSNPLFNELTLPLLHLPSPLLLSSPPDTSL
jgi:hypothetical protein